MIPAVNPFSPNKPVEHDHQFIDQDRVVEAIQRCLNQDKSCSIIGGIGMGKTSILRRIQRKVYLTATPPLETKYRFIPIYFKPDLRDTSSLSLEFAVFALTKRVKDTPLAG